ncbi:MAG: hypothetical protein GY943_34615, partial [Chloroflexi bacterium]|nr:hypothetical protein [Chloroflexota bacterium]
RASYFEVYPGIWRHGDWIKFNERGGCVIYGRSDSTINRKGIRMGTSEIYACVEALDEILDSLVVDLELLDRDSYMPLFVILREGMALDDGLIKAINHKLRIELSPRHVPDEIFHVREIPYKTVSFLRSAWERLPDAPRPTRRRERRIRHSTRSVERGGTRRGVTAYFEFHAKTRNEMRINADKLR